MHRRGDMVCGFTDSVTMNARRVNAGYMKKFILGYKLRKRK